jgi:hypothetical protein
LKNQLLQLPHSATYKCHTNIPELAILNIYFNSFTSIALNYFADCLLFCFQCVFKEPKSQPKSSMDLEPSRQHPNTWKLAASTFIYVRQTLLHIKAYQVFNATKSDK